MADENVLREYLVSLGWKVDEAGKKRFDGALGSAGKTAAAVAAGLTAAATAIAATVIKIASGFDDLYFAAQRTNTSVANIKSLTYALSQLGVPASQAQSAIEGVARAIRTNPGTESLFRTLGVQTRDAQGQIRDTVDILVDLDKALSGKPQYIGAQYAAALGLDEATFNMIRGRAGEIKKLQEEYLKRAGELGVDPDKAAKAANELMTNFRDLQMQIGLVVDKIALDLGPTINKTLNDLQTWIAEHKDEIVEAVKAISKALLGVAEDLVALAKNLRPVWDAFDGMAKAAGKDGLQAAMELVLGYTAGRWLTGMTGSIGKVNLALAYMLYMMGQALNKPFYNWLFGNLQAGPGTPNEGDATKLMNQPAGSASRWQLTVASARSWLPSWLGGDNGKSWRDLTGSTPGAVPANMQAGADRAMRLLIAQGFTPEQAAAIAGNLQQESGFNPNALNKREGAHGLMQWRGSRWENLKQFAADRGMNPNEMETQIAFIHEELTNPKYGEAATAAARAVVDAKTVEEANRALRNYIRYGDTTIGVRGGNGQAILDRYNQRPATPTGDSSRAFPPPLTAPAVPAPAPSGDWWDRNDWLSGKPMLPPGITNTTTNAPTVNQNTTINVTGGSDPVATGREVERAQGRVNQNIIGNVTGAVQ